MPSWPISLARPEDRRLSASVRMPCQAIAWNHCVGQPGTVLRLLRNPLILCGEVVGGFAAKPMKSLVNVELPKLHTRVRFPSPAPVAGSKPCRGAAETPRLRPPPHAFSTNGSCTSLESSHQTLLVCKKLWIASAPLRRPRPELLKPPNGELKAIAR